nr:PREDICTED: INO80 complex subunit B [Bemisia tabaci]XP_018913159.1 PREDICTED: INO80 complex subunit B [Bemisia tabaci]XP_018913160.1 PREDICTED: INO80 complex subunit B [Bemisia tabaci]
MPRPIDMYHGDEEQVAIEEEIDVVTEEISVEPSPRLKRHKKHKHKKHKRKKNESDTLEEIISPGLIDDLDLPQSSIEKSLFEDLKSSFAGISQEDVDLSQKSGNSASDTQTSIAENKIPGLSPKNSSKKKKKEKDGAASSDEERWLNAIESGKLEEVDDELKKIKPKDPKLMTARQRAMFERKTDSSASPAEQLLALPSGYREKVLTPEALQKKALKSQRRKQQADEKREKDKKKTMERLLKKQESKSLKQSTAKSKLLMKKIYPCISYRNTTDLITLSVPENVAFPLESTRSVLTPQVQTCGVKGCDNKKKYTCSKTQVPLCSLTCYKANLLQVR